LAEYGLSRAGLDRYKPLSLDFLFYLGFSCVSIYAAYREMTTEHGVASPFSELPEETALIYGLTPRERDMVRLIAVGLSNKEIAYELSISPATVRTHIYNLFQKAGVQGRIELLHTLYTDKN
jgi:DNA-binding CsgD family transcriptional regulator